MTEYTMDLPSPTRRDKLVLMLDALRKQVLEAYDAKKEINSTTHNDLRFMGDNPVSAKMSYTITITSPEHANLPTSPAGPRGG